MEKIQVARMEVKEVARRDGAPMNFRGSVMRVASMVTARSGASKARGAEVER